jgi:hypothetical protein
MDGDAGFPPTKKAGVMVDGRHTDVVVSVFATHVLVVVTQFGKIGTMVRRVVAL